MMGIYNILSQRYNLKPDQSVLVIYDDKKESIAKGFIDISRQIGARVKGIKLGKHRFEGKIDEIMRSIKRGSFDLFINVFEAKVEETHYRLALTRAESASGGAIGHGPGITRSMVKVAVDYNDMIDKARKLRRILKKAVHVHVWSRLGTDLTIHIKGRKFLDDIMRTSRVSNIPCGEIWCAPIETKGEGVMISDGSIGSLGLLPQPLLLKVEAGRLSEVRWLRHRHRNRVLLKRIRDTFNTDEGASIIGEFGIGLAPYDLCGNMLQDEKAAGTIHVAFGDSSFFGGRNKSGSHMDLLVRSPTVTAHYAGGRPRKFMEKGRLLL
jgi:leucyl aminopeptidase (aminopeptidase T)